MKKTRFLISFTLMAIGVSAQNFNVLYTFDSVKTTTGVIDPTPVPSLSGITFGGFRSVGVASNPNASGRFSFTGWPTGATNGVTAYSALTGKLDTGRYYEVTITPAAQNQMTLNSITFNMQRSSTGVRTYAVYSSTDGYQTALPAASTPGDTNLTVEPGNVFFLTRDLTNVLELSTVPLATSALSGLTSPLTLRFYAYNAESGAGTFSIDNVQISGTLGLATYVQKDQESVKGLVYPNPSPDGSFIVEGEEEMEGTELTIYNMEGGGVHSITLTGTGKQFIGMGDARKGLYLFRFCKGTKCWTRTLVITK